MIVIPERETPGMSAITCAVPIPIAVQRPMSSSFRDCALRSAIQSRTPNTARLIAICHGAPR